jgi:uncharacterized protein
MEGLSAHPMLVIEVLRIPEEGLALDCPLEASQVHLEGEDSFRLEPGGRVSVLLEKGEDQSVHVRGRLAACLLVDCARCLEPFDFEVGQSLDLFYLPRIARQEEEEDVELQDRELVVAYYEAGRIDLGEALREQLFLALPMKRLCRPDCRGLCPVCGANRNSTDCGCSLPDDHVSPFAKLFGKGSA